MIFVRKSSSVLVCSVGIKTAKLSCMNYAMLSFNAVVTFVSKVDVQ